jgi:6-pyruvoyltetrahydropterin/6-carboxytetrahydropterin synthase
MFELSKQFRFDAAHTLHRDIRAEPSRRIHGHSYRAVVTVRGKADPISGMVVDLGVLEAAMEETRDALDHRFLDEVEGLGPGTMENLCRFIWMRLAPAIANLSRVEVHRDSGGESCSYRAEE